MRIEAYFRVMNEDALTTLDVFLMDWPRQWKVFVSTQLRFGAYREVHHASKGYNTTYTRYLLA